MPYPRTRTPAVEDGEMHGAPAFLVYDPRDGKLLAFSRIRSDADLFARAYSRSLKRCGVQ